MSEQPWTLHLGDGGRRLVEKEFTCETCGAAFTAAVRPSRRRKFCSKACAARATKPHLHALSGEAHPAWLGDAVSVRGGRTRARRRYPAIGPCSRCGAARAERHHADGNTSNNEPTNIETLCRRCHMEADGRMEMAPARMREIQPHGVAARWRR